MTGWHHRLHGRESEWTPGVGDGQGGLACCDSWGHKESDTTEWLNWTEYIVDYYRSMNQGQSEVVKQEVARVNVDILGISKLRWTGTGEFNSDDHYIYYCRQESLRRNGVALTQKTLKCSAWVQSQKQQNDLYSFPRKTTQYHSNPYLCPNH